MVYGWTVTRDDPFCTKFHTMQSLMYKKGNVPYVLSYICNTFYINVLSFDRELNFVKSTAVVKNTWLHTSSPPEAFKTCTVALSLSPNLFFYDNILRFKMGNFVLFRLKEHFNSYTFYLNSEIFNLLRN